MTKPKVDTALIETLAELLQRTGLTEIELAEGDSRIRVVQAPRPVLAPVAALPSATPAAAPAVIDQAGPQTAPEDHPGAVRAPMVGTVYLTPEPGAQPFVTLGTEVREGQTLLIIEAMKVMNPIRASRSGRIAKLLVANGDPVEYGELLLIIE
ncbi:MAG TPA: acetyl-CoA carboxylase biotin carboxyl carrier protein subunit [Geminicoccaceae bacterium]